jgi:hypothetical protein
MPFLRANTPIHLFFFCQYCCPVWDVLLVKIGTSDQLILQGRHIKSKNKHQNKPILSEACTRYGKRPSYIPCSASRW